MVGSSIWMCGERLRRLRAGHSLADGDSFHARDRQNVARTADGFIDALQSFERIQLGDLGLVKRAVQLGDGHFIAVPQRAVEHAADGQAAQVIAVIEIRHQQLQDAVGIADGRGDVLQDRVEQRAQVAFLRRRDRSLRCPRLALV